MHERWQAVNPLMALALAWALIFHAALAAQVSPAGHGMLDTAIVHSTMADHHKSHHRHSDAGTVMMKACAGFCSLAGVISVSEPLPSPEPPRVDTCLERTPATLKLPASDPPPRLLV